MTSQREGMIPAPGHYLEISDCLEEEVYSLLRYYAETVYKTPVLYDQSANALTLQVISTLYPYNSF